MADNRSRMRIFLEDVLRMRVAPKPSPYRQLPIERDGDMLGDFLEELEGSQIVDFSELNKFRTIASDRELQYKLFDEMANDSIISAALELYADDATQYNTKGQVIWAEADDPDIAEFANRLIDVLQLNENAWSHIYSLVKYGDLYLELFKDDELDDDPLLSTDIGYAGVKVKDNRVGAKIQEYIEAVPNPAELFDLTKRGKTVGYIKVPQIETAHDNRMNFGTFYDEGMDTDIMPSDKYIHIMLSNRTDRFPEELTISFEDYDNEFSSSDLDSPIKTYKYRIQRGKSTLYDIYKIYQEMRLMEDSLLLNRVTRSSIIRIMQVEVGDMPEANERQVLKRLKNLIEQKNYMDKDAGSFTSMINPGPLDNIVYVPVRDGKGQITTSNIGGDVDVKDIADIDYFSNKLYGGLKIPKQFLGDTDDAAGFSGGTSLTKLDSRYARTIKRIQNAYISGINTLINLFAISHGLTDYINAFTVKMTSPATTEDAERDEQFDNRLRMINDLISLLDNDDITNAVTRKKILVNLIINLLNEPEIASLIEEDDSAEKSISDDNESKESSGPDFDDGPDFSGGGFDDFQDFDTFDDLDNMDNNELDFDNADIETDTDLGGEDLGGEEPFEITPEEFGDFESEA